jgi:RNA polymerase sigma-70 factor (family 1)
LDQLRDINDQSLALLIKKEDKSAFRELFTRYAPRIYSFSYSYLKNKNDTQELVQTVFLKIWEKRNLIDTSQNIKAYIFRITINSIYDFIRRKNIEYAFQNYTCKNQPVNDNTTWDSVIYNDMQYTLCNLVLQLPKQQQMIFNLSKMEGLTNDEISVKMKLSKRTVENHLYRAISFLKQKIKYESIFTVCLLLSFFS